VKIGPAVRPGRRIEKKGKDGTGQSKKSHGGNISPIWGEADLITQAKFQDDIVRGYDFTGSRISHFPIDFFDCAACDEMSLI